MKSFLKKIFEKWTYDLKRMYILNLYQFGRAQNDFGKASGSLSNITAVIPTFHRPSQLRRVVSELVNCGIPVVVIANDNSKRPRWAGRSIVWVQCSKNMGLDVRFAIAATVKTEFILSLDDDILLPRATVEKMAHEVSHCEGMIGLVGRNPSPENEYDGKPVYGDAEIILSGACMFRRELIQLFFAARESKIIRKARERFLEFPETHAENGEDLIFSYAIRRHFGKTGKVLQLPFQGLENGPRAISDLSDHYKFRTVMMRACQEYCRSETSESADTPAKTA